MRPQRPAGNSGFALILTLSLLALLVLSVVALSALVRVSGQVSTTSAYQTKARQNALLGLNAGLGELQRAAGVDGNITAMAGVTGVGANANSSTRHWCGVWTDGGALVTWLSSGAGKAIPPPVPTVDPIAMVGTGTVGAATSNSEHVLVGKIPITVTGVPGVAAGTFVTVGKYAYWVGDEGVKISAYAPGALLTPLLASSPETPGPATLQSARVTYASKLGDVISFEQLSLLPTPAAALKLWVLRDAFHHTTLTSRTVDRATGGLTAGLINVNTSSTMVWRGILETYNSSAGTDARISLDKLPSAADAMATGMAASASGKSAYGPFLSLTGFLESSLLSSAITRTGGITVAQFADVMSSSLTVRSDTFRIRGYGEALNPVDGTVIEATAYCEAIVQRTPEVIDATLGRRFVVTYFRWLGPDDI